MAIMETIQIGIVAIDKYDCPMGNLYIAAKMPVYSEEESDTFFARCNALLRVSKSSHARLVAAAIEYCTATADMHKIPEVKANLDVITAFMGEGFDVACLGTWTKLKGPAEWNAPGPFDDFQQCFVFFHTFDGRQETDA